MSAFIAEGVRPEHKHLFSLEQFAEFASAVRHYAAERRREWGAQFGPATFPARTREAFERIILPKCVPVDRPVVKTVGGIPSHALSRP